jgi:hypothetical protein
MVCIYQSTVRILTFLTGSTALHFTAVGALLAAKRIRILLMNQHALWPITFGMKGSSHPCSQISGRFENPVSLNADISRTGGRGSDLAFEVVL